MIQEKVSLREYNTFRINFVADLLVTIASEKELQDYILTVKNLKEKYLVLGGGSNMLFSGDFRGTIIHPSIKGIDLTKEDSECVHVVAGAGVAWDDLVSWSVNAGYGGLENLSLIPGSVGAVPVQNIGAYGVEAGPRITRVKTINISDGSIKYFTSGECRFGYRDSIFKSELKGRLA
ncbi:MAG: FAD-binding protein [Bacteroidales bacterium]